MYNYYEEMKSAINDKWNWGELNEYLEGCAYIDDFGEKLSDELFCDDYITGNGSGSYTFSRYKAMEYVMDNKDLLKEAYEEFGQLEKLGDDFVSDNWEDMDVTIRCYILGTVISDWIEDNEQEIVEAIANMDEAEEN